jgi:glycosyltransferase involved in cell wall biosynthesis
MKILLLGNSLKGMIKFRWDIIKYLADQGHQIYIVCPFDLEDYQIKYHYKNVFFHPINLCCSINLTKDLVTFFLLNKDIKKLNPDVIFSYALKASFFSMLANWKIPNVYFITGMGSSLINKYKWLIKKVIYLLTHARKLIIKHQDLFVFLNNDDRDYFTHNKLCLENHAVVFPGEGVDLDFFKLSPLNELKTPISFLFIGRLIRDKGVMELIDACEKMQKKQIHFTCTAIAPIDHYNPSSLHTINLDSFQKVGIQYIPYANDVRAYIQACDVLVLPSYAEGLPRVLLEGMAMGRAVIATDTHGCRELVHHDNGIVVKVKDVQSLYDAMVCMSMKSKSELKELGLAGYKKVKEKYSLSSVINSYQMLIDNIANKA